MIAVTGSTGQLGTLIIEALLKKKVPAKEIIAIARDPGKAKFSDKGVKVRKADYNDPAGWDAALKGVTKLLLISSNELGKRAEQHQTVIDAAVRHGKIELIAYTSLLHAQGSALGLAKEHLDTEKALKASKLPFAVLRNGWYSENHTQGIAAALKQGTLYGASGKGRVSSAPRLQYAQAAAEVLTEKKTQAGKVYELAGDSSYSMKDFAEEVATQSGKKLVYQNMPEAEYKALLLKAGLPEPIAAMLADSDTGASRGSLYDGSHQLSRLIGESTVPIKGSIAAALKKA